jgi:hypothetical protein
MDLKLCGRYWLATSKNGEGYRIEPSAEVDNDLPAFLANLMPAPGPN